jgi:ribonuclease Z
MGYPDLMFTPAVTGREEPLEVYGPKGLTRMTRLIERAWSEDRDIRIHGLEHGNPKAYEVHVHEIAPGEIYQDANVKVRAFLVNHGTWKFAFGYRFETPDRVIVISGDTTYSKNLIENAKGCDVLIHEVYSGEGLVKRTAQWQKYHSTFHTSARDVGLIGSLIKPKLLILYHELPFGEPDGEILGEVKSVYNGPVVEAHDLERF